MTLGSIRRLLIANRGEIAIRIARTARRLGISSVAVASDADRDAPHARACDDVVAIGGERAADSYLRIGAIVDAARASGADAVHPGYGFLSENADAADAVLAAGLTWIGPPPAAMRTMADKAEARRHVAAIGVATVPGYDGEAQDPKTLAREATRIGYPVMVKAAAGGGGRGMRVVASADALAAAVASAAEEARAAFGDARLLLERALVGARHVELQVFADRQGACIHLGERDCSVQRRHQKLIEEAPSPAVSPALRRAMGDAAVAIARSVGYVGAGTVEFLLDADRQTFHFIEMNTRLQVEHAVTEALVGVDLVEWQLRVAAGEALPMQQDEALQRFEAGGHAVEARLVAEDASRGHLPQSGRIVAWRASARVRVDHGVESGTVVSAFYDSLLAKLVAHAPTRSAAIESLARALDETVCLGIATNRRFLADVLRHPVFVAGEATTDFLARGFAASSADPSASSALEALAAASVAVLASEPLPPLWRDWSSSPHVDRVVPLCSADGVERAWRLEGTRDALVVSSGDVRHTMHGLARDAARAEPDGCDAVSTTVDGRRVRAVFARDGVAWWWQSDDGAELAVVDASRLGRRSAEAPSEGTLLAPLHGRVTQVAVPRGASVARGDLLLVIEAMKMEHQVRAPRAGTVTVLHAKAGDQVAARQRLVEIA